MDLDIVYNENCLEGLKKLPDESVDCVVTSPPYYGLRDYGTGTWVGGDPNCDHEDARKKTRFDYAIDEKQSTSKGTDMKIYEKVCPICGAVRVDEQIGLEETPEEYINRLVSLFREIRRVLKKDGTCWVNLGDSYSGNCSRTSKGRAGMGAEREGVFKKGGVLPSKNLIGIPWRFAFAMQNDGWILRQDIIWAKPNPMPESVTDRCTKSHEYIFLFSKNQRYYYDYKAIQEKAVSSDDLERRVKNGKAEWKTDKAKDTYAVSGEGRDRRELYTQNENGEYMRNKRDVWSVPTKPDKVAHFATYPEELIIPCILAGSKSGGVILDPFMGSGTTARVARKLNRHFIGFELNPEYCKIINKKTQVTGDLFY